MYADFGITIGMEVKTDASAAKGIAHRTGLGKLRHLETSQLWIQAKVADGILKVTKVPGNLNKSDAMTKFMTDLSQHLFYQPVLHSISLCVCKNSKSPMLVYLKYRQHMV